MYTHCKYVFDEKASKKGSNTGTPYCMRVLIFFKWLKKRTGIGDKQVSAHQCRRYIVTTQLATGRSPLDDQRQMGHSTLHMTNRYASLTIDHLKKSHERHSPLPADINGYSEVLGTRAIASN